MRNIPEILCQFNSNRCLCQWCENQCNDGLNCHDCDFNKKQKHDIYMCTGFVGTYPGGYTSQEVHEHALDFLNRRNKNNEGY